MKGVTELILESPRYVELKGLESRENWLQDLLDHTRFYPVRGKWPMNWNCQKCFLQFTTCSMSAS